MAETTETASHHSDFLNNSARTANVLVLLLWIMLGMVILRTAWVSDDAYISFRTVDNFVNGYGLRWNVDERVQSFTNPLWVMLISIPYAITGEIYYTSIFFSLLIVLLTALLIARRIAISPYAALIAFTGLICSKAFIDYSTSGLEQPLLYFLFALFIWQYAKFDGRAKTFGKLALIASLSAVTRMDTLLLYGPALLALFWQCRSWKAVKYGLLGFIPLITWEAFSMLYYGFPFPNTYYAKLHAGIPVYEMIEQGLIYYIATLHADPVTLFVIAAALLLVLFRQIRGYTAIALGIGLYLCYIMRTGGDFMGGRFFALPFLGAAILISTMRWERTQTLCASALLLLLGFAAPHPNLTANSNYGLQGNSGIGPNGITDERGSYYQATGLLKARRGIAMPDHEWSKKGKGYALGKEPIVSVATVGFTGFYSGPHVHIVDRFALTEPLFARLPTNINERWVVGHLARTAPLGYMKSLQTGTNQIIDSNLAKYYDKLCMLTKEPVFTFARFKTIAEMNTGEYDYLLAEAWNMRTPTVNYTDVCIPIREGTGWNTQGMTILQEIGVEILFDSIVHSKAIEVSLDNNDRYAVCFYRDTLQLERVDIANRSIPNGGMRLETVTIPAFALRSGYNRIHIFPFAGDGAYSLGHLRLVDLPFGK